MKHFDYIIAGGGCSGRSLAIRLLPYLKATNKQALLVDSSIRKVNDKTWCFWEEKPDLFEAVVCKKWHRLSFSSSFIHQESEIYPYEYKMIRSADFYAYTDKMLIENPHIIILKGTVENLYTENELACAVVDGVKYSSDYTFSSIPQIQTKKPERYQYLLQHFLGWIIETEDIIFDAECATLMDFNTSQEVGPSFVYVLPLTSRCALVEYTVFSEQLLAAKDYTDALKDYITQRLQCNRYSIKEQEYGIIPMTDHPIQNQENRVIYLGTAGGYTKGSTGYTFRFIQKHTAAIVEQLLKSGTPNISSIFPKRFRTYDAILLHLLASGRVSGEEIFSTMFQKNKSTQILKFLDNETTPMEELHIFKTLNKKEFARALLNRTLKPFRI
ncbi:lycopene cyclase [Pedobacter sp. HMWF019]|uniref:lycopene cyclase family protein n=1 Tax=Pedobacter sp. HMWF019 TaxID=2056856 RepID=UPI000D393772|nr:lycopene cyclase family protein [Pedobacter sp. HMWF019]PTS99693.1 lycopene cyclase [Pedobacter sp. HMWF019]